jgi:hypothetical protein
MIFIRIATRERIVLGTFQHKIHSIVRLLRLKGENICREIPSRISEPKINISSGTPYLVDDSPESILNQDETFAETNNIILNFSGDTHFLDITKCRTIKRKIEKSTGEEQAEYLIDSL